MNPIIPRSASNNCEPHVMMAIFA